MTPKQTAQVTAALEAARNVNQAGADLDTARHVDTIIKKLEAALSDSQRPAAPTLRLVS